MPVKIKARLSVTAHTVLVKRGEFLPITIYSSAADFAKLAVEKKKVQLFPDERMSDADIDYCCDALFAAGAIAVDVIPKKLV